MEVKQHIREIIHMRFTLLSLVFLLAGCNAYLFCQNATRSVTGIVLNRENNTPVEGVNVFLRDNKTGVTTDTNGYFKIDNIKKNEIIVFSHIGYKTDTLKTDKLTKINDVKIYLNPDIVTLQEIEIIQKRKIDKEYAYILDYNFFQKQILILKRNLQNRNFHLLLLHNFFDTISTLTLPADCKLKEIFIDCFGNCQLIGKDSTYQLALINSKLKIVYKFDSFIFNKLLRNCLFATRDYLVFKKKINNGYILNYYGISKKNHAVINFITKNETNKLNETRRYINWLIKNGFKGDIAAMTRFQYEIMSPPANQPVFLIKNKIYYFNWINDKIEIYNDNLIKEGVISVKYRKLENWKQQFLFDNARDKIYTIVKINNYFYLTNINIKSGQLGERKKIPYLFFDKLKINNGYIYLIDRSFNQRINKNCELKRISLKKGTLHGK